MITDMLTTPCTVTAMRMVSTLTATPIIRNRMDLLPRMTDMVTGTRRLIRLRCMVTGTLTTIMAPHSCASHTVMGTVRQTASPSVCLAPTTAPVWLS